MSVMSTAKNGVSSIEGRVIEVLREQGPQTLECLCALPDVSWAQVLLAVDHLSRSCTVAIERIAPCEYQVSLNGTGT
ncbi:MAG: hypothetical protein H8K10_18160 [Nitrospira sp.]|nr:hypothetical protein [Nitrospira sp.]